MSGSMKSAVYHGDNGTDYAIRLPQWEYDVTDHGATLTQSGSAATTEPALPRGVARRKRFYKITATGKEGSFTVLSAASNLWTSGRGTAILIPLFNAATPGSDNATLEGRTGEKTRG